MKQALFTLFPDDHFTVFLFSIVFFFAWGMVFMVKYGIYKAKYKEALKHREAAEKHVDMLSRLLSGQGMRLNKLVQLAGQMAKEAGFNNKETDFGALLMYVNAELCESLDADRKGKKAMSAIDPNYTYLQYFEERIKGGTDYKTAFIHYLKDKKETELADAVIMLCSVISTYEIDIEKFILYVLRYAPYREEKHGKLY